MGIGDWAQSPLYYSIIYNFILYYFILFYIIYYKIILYKNKFDTLIIKYISRLNNFQEKKKFRINIFLRVFLISKNKF